MFVNNIHFYLFTHTFFWFYFNIFIFYLIDIYSEKNKNFFNKYKIQKKNIDWDKYKKTFNFVLKQQLFINYPTSYIFYNNIIIKNDDYIYYNEIQKLILCFAFSDIYFYITHRILHLKYFYKNIHKKHHEWIIPSAISATYAHPIEHLISNIGAVYIPLVITNAHLYTYLFYQTLGIFNAVLSHSNYNFINNSHNIHHKKFNYNFGLGYTDDIFKTNFKKK